METSVIKEYQWYCGGELMTQLNNEGGDININGSNSANLVKLGSHRIQFGGVATINYNSTSHSNFS